MTTRKRIAALIGATALAATGVLPAPSAHAQPADDEIGSLMLVLDASGSMRDPDGTGTTRIAAAHKALTTVVENLPAHATVGMRVFGAQITGTPMPQEACQDTQRVVDLGTDNRAQLLSAISTYQPHGWTPIPEALRQAANDLGPEGKRHIILVSDGESTCDPDPCEVAADIAAQGIGITIDVVGLNVDNTTRTQLTCIAEAGGGEYVDATNADELTAALNHTTTRATRPFEYDGTPIQGTPDLQDAPQITPGIWTDTVGPARTPDVNRYYRLERTVKDSTLQASAVTLLSRDLMDHLRISIVDGNDHLCGSPGTAIRHSNNLGLATIGAELRPFAACSDEDVFWVKVSREQAEATTDLPIELRIQELPALAPGEPGPEPIISFEGDRVAASDPIEVQPGTSMATAPLLTPGQSVTTTILPNEVQTYRVPVGWGQSVRATMERFERILGHSGFLKLVALYPSGSIGDSPAFFYAREASHATVETKPIWAGSSDGANPAGDVTLIVIWEADKGAEGDPLDYTLTAEIGGELEDAPEYLIEPISAATEPEPEPTDSEEPSPSPEPSEEASTPSNSPTPEATPDATVTEAAPDEDAGTSSTALALAGLGGLLVIGGGITAAMLLRRRH